MNSEPRQFEEHSTAPDGIHPTGGVVVASVMMASEDEWVKQWRELVQSGTDEELHNALLSLRRLLDLEGKRRRFSSRTSRHADQFLSLVEPMLQERKAVGQLQAKLEHYHRPDQRQNLSPREMTELRQTVLALRERLQPFQQLRSTTLDVFDRFVRSRHQDLVEEDSLRRSSQEYLQWVDQRLRGHLETQIRSKMESLAYEQRVESLRTFIQKLLQTCPSISQAEIERLCALAQGFYEQGHIDAAIENLAQALEYGPKQGKIHFRMAECLLKKNERVKAIEALTRAKRCEPNNPAYRLALARQLEEIGRRKDAIHHYLAAHQIQPHRWLILTRLAKLAYEEEQWELAIPLLGKILEKQPGSIKTLRRLGMAQITIGDCKEGIPRLKDAIRRKDDDSEVHHYLGRAYLLKRQLPDALNELLSAYQAAPNDLKRIYWLGQAYFEYGDYDQVIPLCRRFLEKQARDADATLLLARTLRHINELEPAIETLRPILDQGKKRSDVLVEFATACIQASRSEDAYQVLKHFVTPDSHNEELRRVFGLTCIHAGHFKEAVSYTLPANHS